MQDAVGLLVRDAQVSLIGLALHEISGRRLLDDRVRHTDVTGELAHLRLEEIAQRIDRRGIIRVPREVAHEPFRLVTRPEWKRLDPRREIEQRDHTHAGHHVAPPRWIGVPVRGINVPVHRLGDVHRFKRDTKLLGN